MLGVFFRRMKRDLSGAMALLALIAAWIASIAAAEAQQPASWRISSASGIVRVAEPGRPPAPAQVGAVVRDGAIISTGPDGLVTVVGPHGRMNVAPNSRVTLRKDAQGFSRILQDAGSILYSIDKRAARHFQVDAPLMTAVVKGTTFTVLVTDFGNSVSVQEGLVEIRARRGSVNRDIGAGMMAWVLRAAPTIINEGQIGRGFDLGAPNAEQLGSDLRAGEQRASPARVQEGAPRTARDEPPPDASGAPFASGFEVEGDGVKPKDAEARSADEETGLQGDAKKQPGWTVGGSFAVDQNVLLLSGVLFAIALLGFAPLFWSQIRSQALADPAYETISQDGSIELRRYDPAVTAEASSSGERKQALHTGIEFLAAYASGGNSESARIPKTPPFTQTRSGGVWTVSFIVARHVGVDAAPAPRAPAVRLRFQPARTILAMPVSSNNARALEQKAEHLHAWAARNGFEVVGSPAYAFHGPLWIPAAFRRTEVLVTVRAREVSAGVAGARQLTRSLP